jgi:hypothetical protein
MATHRLRKRIDALERVFSSECDPTGWMADLARIIEKMGLRLPRLVVFRWYVSGRTQEELLLLERAVKHWRQGRRRAQEEWDAINRLMRDWEIDVAAL